MYLQVCGVDTYCYTGGKPFNSALPTLVFVHGAQQDHSVWDALSPWFAGHGFGVLAIDLPGHGRTHGLPLTSIEAHAAWLVALLDAAQVQDASLIGHSMGSLIVLEAAFQAPDRINKLVMLGANIPMTVADSLLNTAKNDPEKASEMIHRWSHSMSDNLSSIPAPWLKFAAFAHRKMHQLFKPTNVLHTDLLACNGYANGIFAAQSVQCPTLLIFAKQDKMTPLKSTSALITALTNSKIAIIDNCGHALMEEQPNAVLAELKNFFG